jgi:hypothetical protein
MFGRSLLSLSRATFAKPIRAPTTAFATPALTRNYMVIVDASDNEDQIRFELGEFANDAQNMGCNSHPYYRRVSGIHASNLLIETTSPLLMCLHL